MSFLRDSAEEYELKRIGLFDPVHSSPREDLLQKFAAHIWRVARAVRHFRHDERNGYNEWRASICLRAFCDRHPIGTDEWGIVVCGFHSGDVYMLSSLARALLAKHGGRKVIFFTSPQHAFIPKLFPSVAESVPVEPEIVDSVQEHVWFWQKDCPKGGLFRPLRAAAVMMGCKGLTCLDIWRGAMQLPWDTEPESPRLPDPEENRRAEAFLSRNGLLPGKIAILCPDAQSTFDMPEIPKELWLELAMLFESRGITPITNLGPKTVTVGATRGVHIPLELMRAVAMQSRCVVAKRNGLCDLLSDLPLNLTVLYPKGNYIGGRFIDVASLKAMQLGSQAVEEEVTGANYRDVLLRITK